MGPQPHPFIYILPKDVFTQERQLSRGDRSYRAHKDEKNFLAFCINTLSMPTSVLSCEAGPSNGNWLSQNLNPARLLTQALIHRALLSTVGMAPALSESSLCARHWKHSYVGTHLIL